MFCLTRQSDIHCKNAVFIDSFKAALFAHCWFIHSSTTSHPCSSFYLGSHTKLCAFHIPLHSHSIRVNHDILKLWSSHHGLYQRPEAKRMDRIWCSYWRASDDPPVDRLCLPLRLLQRDDQSSRLLTKAQALLHSSCILTHETTMSTTRTQAC